MPVIKSAIKKLRIDKKREKANDAFRDILEQSIKIAKKTGSKEAISSAFSNLDKAVKNNIIHKNKAARIKSSLTKSKPDTKPAVETKPAAKKTVSPKAKSAKTSKKAKTASKK